MDPLPAILLAAGQGARLRPLTASRPKAMVEVGGEPLAARAIRTLRAAGIKRVIAVTGYRPETLTGLDCEARLNPRWESDENVVSLWSVRDVVERGCYVVNSDVVFVQEIAERLVGEPGTFVLCDPSGALDDEAMKAQVREGRLVALSKDTSLDDSAGEYIGLLRVDPADGPFLSRVLESFVGSGRTDVYYEAAIEELARDRPVRAVSVAGLPWAEIDDHRDLARAEKEVVSSV